MINALSAPKIKPPNIPRKEMIGLINTIPNAKAMTTGIRIQLREKDWIVASRDWWYNLTVAWKKPCIRRKDAPRVFIFGDLVGISDSRCLVAVDLDLAGFFLAGWGGLRSTILMG